MEKFEFSKQKDFTIHHWISKDENSLTLTYIIENIFLCVLSCSLKVDDPDLVISVIKNLGSFSPFPFAILRMMADSIPIWSQYRCYIFLRILPSSWDNNMQTKEQRSWKEIFSFHTSLVLEQKTYSIMSYWVKPIPKLCPLLEQLLTDYEVMTGWNWFNPFRLGTTIQIKSENGSWADTHQ